MNCSISNLFRRSPSRAGSPRPQPTEHQLAERLPEIWRELKLPGNPGPQAPLPTRKAVQSTFETLDAALREFEWGRASASPSLDAWLHQGSAGDVCLKGVVIGSSLEGHPHFIAHPSPAGSLNAYMAKLLALQVKVVVALAPSPWWPHTEAADFGGTRVTPRETTWHLMGRSRGMVEVTETSCLLERGADHHQLTVLQIPWPDFGTLPPTAFAQCIAMAHARAERGLMAVHCGAGLGRTGTFIMGAQLLGERGAEPLELGLLGQAALAFLWTRIHRPGAVETSDQFASTLRAALTVSPPPIG